MKDDTPPSVPTGAAEREPCLMMMLGSAEVALRCAETQSRVLAGRDLGLALAANPIRWLIKLMRPYP